MISRDMSHVLCDLRSHKTLRGTLVAKITLIYLQNKWISMHDLPEFRLSLLLHIRFRYQELQMQSLLPE